MTVLAAARLRRRRAFVDPSSLSGLAVWLKADAITGVDGDPVGTWADSSASARNATQATAAAKPTLRTGVLNGKPVVRFDGVDDSLGLPTLAALTAAEVFIVVKITNDPPLGANVAGIWDFGTDATNSTNYPWTDGTIYDAFGSTARKTTVNPTPSLAAWRLYNVISTAGEWTSALDGTQLFTTATNTVGLPAAPLLGKSKGAFFLSGDVAEFVLYDHKLATSERTSVKSYIATKYALTIA